MTLRESNSSVLEKRLMLRTSYINGSHVYPQYGNSILVVNAYGSMYCCEISIHSLPEILILRRYHNFVKFPYIHLQKLWFLGTSHIFCKYSVLKILLFQLVTDLVFFQLSSKILYVSEIFYV
jgi:hypothetical protein